MNRNAPAPIEWCRAYFEHEHGTSISEANGGGAKFEHDPSLSAIVRSWDPAVVPTLWDYASQRQLRRSLLRRAKAMLGRGRRGPTRLFSTEGPVPRGLVLLPRKNGNLVALDRAQGRVVKVEDAHGRSTLRDEHASLVHLASSDMSHLSSELPADGGLKVYESAGRSFRLLRTSYHRNSRPVTVAEWPSLLRDWLVPHMFHFYRSWGVVEVDAEEHVEGLRAGLEEQGLGSCAMSLVDLVDRSRVSSRTRTVHLTRCHGDLKPANVHRDGQETRILDWGNSMEANLFFDLSIPFLYAHHYAGSKSNYVSPTVGLDVHDGTTQSAASKYVRQAELLTAERYDAAKLSFHVLCSLAERLLFNNRTQFRLLGDDRSHLKLMHTLAQANVV